jgi:regulator of CtrA degradation
MAPATAPYTGPVTFLNRTYDEAMGLLVETRTYLLNEEPQDRAVLPAADCLALTLETTRLTAMMTQVMAWLLVQRAVGAGEISREAAAASENRLVRHEVCGDDRNVGNPALPARFRDLLARGHRLHTRVSRLDELFGRAETLPAPVSA